MNKIIGIDEAGRGPVIGPLVMCGISISEKKVKELVKLGVKDSKLLTPQKRELLFPMIEHIVDNYKVVMLTPTEIDNMIKSGTNLNQIEMNHTAEIINKLNGVKAIIDCPSPNIPKYSRELKTKLTKEIELQVEHKADLNNPEVSAASIIAKVIRDREIQKLQEQYDADFGSGYTSDPLTQKFIEENWQKYPELFRKSWSSWKKLKFNKDQKKLGDF